MECFSSILAFTIVMNIIALLPWQLAETRPIFLGLALVSCCTCINATESCAAACVLLYSASGFFLSSRDALFLLLNALTLLRLYQTHGHSHALTHTLHICRSQHSCLFSPLRLSLLLSCLSLCLSHSLRYTLFSISARLMRLCHFCRSLAGAEHAL